MAGTVIIGAGQAGSVAAGKLRDMGYQEPVTLIGEEPHIPYQRPPLSKAYLLGDMALERMYLRPETYYDEKDITLITDTRVEAIDRSAKALALSDGRNLGYDSLILTTGSLPIRLPADLGGDLEGVYTVRTLADADSMAPEFAEGRRALIVGGGYIGLEAAAVAAKRGVETVLVEASDRILQRVAADQTSDYFRAVHQDHGVRVLEGTMLERLEGTDGRVARAHLSDGSALDVDFVIVGIGIRPDTALAEAAGIELENGIRVDAQCRTSDPDIYAAGDCASFPYRGGRIRLESVGNAIDQAEAAAAAIAGQPKDYVAKPWFWSDQYDIKLQIAGLSSGYDSIVERRGAGATVSFWYYRGDDLVSIDAMNDARSYMVAKRLIDAGKTADKARVADMDVPVKDLLK